MSTTNFKLGSESFEFSERVMDSRVQCHLTSLHSGITIQWDHPLYPFAMSHPRFHPLTQLSQDADRLTALDELQLQLACEGIGLWVPLNEEWTLAPTERTQKLINRSKTHPALSDWTGEWSWNGYNMTAPGCLNDYLPFETLAPMLPFLSTALETGLALRDEVLVHYWQEPLATVVLYYRKTKPLPSHLQPLSPDEQRWFGNLLTGKELTHAFNARLTVFD